MHNNIYNTLDDVCESLKQLVQDEDLKIENEKTPQPYNLSKYLEKHDDYFGQLTNDTWYDIQSYPVFRA